jgi:UDP-glucose 4-epimerase
MNVGTVCVTGGAGYIGSHMVRVLRRAGHGVVVIDDLSAGHADALPADVPLVRADVRDRSAVAAALRDHRVEAVLHFASRIQVGESVVEPLLYWRDNLGAAIALVETALDAGVKHFVLSSTAAVYGDPVRVPLDEDHPTAPVNPYGETKLAMERMLADYARAYGISYAALRYFNASGADTAAGIGERHDPETHLIPIVLEAALGLRRHVTLFGDDYATPDGTCVRDYIHVLDLAEAHLVALAYLGRGGESGPFNLGTGQGHSVREVIDVAKRVTKRDIPVVIGPRRPGDSPELVASADRAARVLGWRARRSSLEEIVRDAWVWHSRSA